MLRLTVSGLADCLSWSRLGSVSWLMSEWPGFWANSWVMASKSVA